MFEEVGKDLNMKVRWDYGMVAETADKAYRIHVGGRTQIAGTWISTTDEVMFGPGGIGQADDAVNFRRARLEVDGTIFETVQFWCEYDFLNTFAFDRRGATQVANSPVPTDLWMQFTKLPAFGNIRVGNQKPPISFEHLTSSRFLNFIERSLGFDAFIEDQDNGFRPGIQAFDWSENENFTWAYGIFKNNKNIFGWNVGDGEYDVTGRVTWCPWYEQEGRYLLHFGLGGSYRDADDNIARYRARILIRNGPAALHNVLAEARLGADSEARINPELVLQLGPFLIQSEYYGAWTTGATPLTPPNQGVDLGSVYYQSWYLEALYFLTGEHRVYDRRYPRFDRVVPHQNAFIVDGVRGLCCGKGAWQVGARYSFINLIGQGINGGAQSNAARVDDVTLGLNWFLNGNAKLQWNYSFAYRHAQGGLSNGPIHAFGTQLAFDF
jgi:phosphate-selective porin OprO/OprP